MISEPRRGINPYRPAAGNSPAKRHYLLKLPLALVLLGLVSPLFSLGNNDKVKFERRELQIILADGSSRAILAEIAENKEQRAQGLMFRKTVPDGEGMLFVFERDEVVSFWMKDTYVPLSIAFIAYDGRILEIRDMESKNTSSIRSSRAVRYALEVPQGWFIRAGIGVGDRLVL